jgi:type II secretory pathway pseudopilin PulG
MISVKKTKMYKAKQKNAFTLIELLSIIIILAIIAVITVPIVLNIIDNSKKGAVKSSAYGYKDAINKFYLEKLSEDKNYIIEDNFYELTELKEMGITSNGEEPLENSWVEIKKNIIVSGCLQYDEYKIEIINGEVTNAEKNQCETYKPLSFKNDSWKTFIENVKSNNPARTSKYEVGDTAKIKMTIDNQENEYTVRIANKPRVQTDSDYEAYNAVCSNENNSKTACGWVIEFVDIITTHRMNKYTDSSTNGDGDKGGWQYSDMRAYLNNGIYLEGEETEIDYTETGLLSFIPDQLKSAIIDTKVVTGRGSSDSNHNQSIDKLYLLAQSEVDNDKNNDYTGRYTRQLDYYEQNKVIARTDNDKIIKKNLSNNISNYWLRSCSPYFSKGKFNYICERRTGCGWYSNTNYGVAPAFRIAD